jgi:XTP/dITP diphosphohydrolase
VVATKNKKKLQEIRELLSDLPFCVTSLEDYPDAPRIVEDGRTFEQNAIKKAATIALYTRKLVLGEDSGLEVKALHNRPGVYSARYAGEGATDKKNNRRLLSELKGVSL